MPDKENYILDEKKLEEAIALATHIVDQNSQKQNVDTPGNLEGTGSNAAYGTNDIETIVKKSHGKNSGRLVWKIVLFVSLIVFVFCLVKVVIYMVGHNRTMEAEKKMRSYVDYGNSSEDTSGQTTSKRQPEDTFPQIKVDFGKLQSVNPDISAWIFIPGTDVDYPVLKGDDNSYYLSHDAYGRYSPDGSIFMDSDNDRSMQDFDTVIYGHNMSTGTMFKTLHNYEDEKFLDKYRDVYLYMPGKTICYKVFAAYRTNDRRILGYYDFSNMDDRKRYLNNIFSCEFDTGIVKNDEKVDVDDRILTLSTCCGMDGKRWIIQAVYISENEIQ